MRLGQRPAGRGIAPYAGDVRFRRIAYGRLRDTRLGLIFIDTLINLPLAVWLMQSFFDDAPVDVDEAAMLDGTTRFQMFWQVVLPLVTGLSGH